MHQEKVKESFIKYLAGLMDSDGCLSLEFRKISNGKFSVSTRLTLAQRSDRMDMLKLELFDIGGSFKTTSYENQSQWVLNKKEELNKLLPRLLKHMVIKAKYWKWLLETKDYYSRNPISEEERESLSLLMKYKRQELAGPLKPKNHPSWAWVAGYLDGDGWYSCPTSKSKTYCVSVACDKKDFVAVQLLHKAFGGTISEPKSKPNMFVWYRGLGPQNSSFTFRFLPKVHFHSRLKKHKMEMILHNLRQRLTEKNSTE